MKTKLLFLFIVVAFAHTTYAQTDESITVDSRIRSYKLYIPENLDTSKPVLLIVSMHGIGGASDFFFTTADIRPLADELNAIVVSPQAFQEEGSMPPLLAMFPDAAVAFNRFASAAWGCGLFVSTAGGLVTFEFNKDVADEEFIRQVIVKTQTAYPAITNKNVFLLGTSMGAFMGNQYAEKYDDFGGFISVVGSRGLQINNTPHVTGAIPVCLFNSETDELVGYSGSATLGGIPVTICESIDDVVTYWKTRNNTPTTGTTSPLLSGTNGNTATKTVYGSDNNEVVFYKMQNVAHTNYLSTANNDCLDYNTEIKDFIGRHALLSPANIPAVSVDLATARILSVQVIDVSGRLVYSQSGNVDIKSIQLHKGLYILYINTDQGTVIKKVIK
jgi:poly(3-hydroxybutyrate) depolymerase